MTRWMLIVGLVLASLGDAHADDPLAKPNAAEAREHLSRGNKLYNVRSFEEAIAEYKAGALIESVPVWDYNLGQCYRQLGKYQEAIWHYERFLARAQPTGEIRDAITGFISQMKSELDQKAKTQQPTAPAPSLVEPSRLPPAVEPSPREPAEQWYQDGFGWGMAGVGVLGIATGALLLVDASSLFDDANANPDATERDSLRDKGDTRQLLGGVIGAVGGALLVTGAIKLVVHSDPPTSSTSWNVGASPTGIVVFGAF